MADEKKPYVPAPTPAKPATPTSAKPSGQALGGPQNAKAEEYQHDATDGEATIERSMEVDAVKANKDTEEDRSAEYSTAGRRPHGQIPPGSETSDKS